jgi:hypothetical protein
MRSSTGEPMIGIHHAPPVTTTLRPHDRATRTSDISSGRSARDCVGTGPFIERRPTDQYSSAEPDSGQAVLTAGKPQVRHCVRK